MGFVTFEKSDIVNGRSKVIPMENAEKFLALYNCNVYWVIPKAAESSADIPDCTQFLLWKKNDGSYGIMLPLIDGDIKAALCGAQNGVEVTFRGALKGQEPDNAVLLYCDSGNDPYKLAENAVRAICEKLGSFKMRKDKKQPDFLNSLGWCTWDAFYGSVDEEKVIMGLESFKNKGIPLGYMILDDGSWDAYYDYLNDIRLKPEKFPSGLKNLIKLAKEKYDLKKFGVWHCFEGYWGGIKPDGEVAKRYNLIGNKANIRPWEEEEHIQPLYLVAPDEIEQFYEELHSYLHEQGADMLKIDGQSALELFTSGVLGAAGTMKAYQKSMQKSAKKYFDGNVIHCMSNGNDVAYNMEKTNCWRNSYDYSPSNMKMQKEHIYINAMNAMWTSTFAVPDWDMFQTHSAGADIHAAARAISGGPVYVCDYPEKQDADILRRLILSDGSILGCKEPALPAEDCLFTDFTSAEKPMKLFNRNGKAGVIGFFNCCTADKTVKGSFKPSDVYGISGERFAVYFYNGGTLKAFGRDEECEIELSENGFELVTAVPIENGFAAIGLADKYNSSAAIKETICTTDGFVITLSDGGKIAVYSESKPVKVFEGRNEIAFEYSEENGLLMINSTVKGLTEIKIIVK